MTTSDLGSQAMHPHGSITPAGARGGAADKVKDRWHRIAEVRREQGMSLRRVAYHMRIPIEQAQAEEDGSADLTLSRLYRWQEVLDVPVADLLVDCELPLSMPVLQRARMVRLMKTVAAIVEKSDCAAVRRLAETMAAQLIEIMPELDGITPWNAAERERSPGDAGQLEPADDEPDDFDG